VATPIGNLQDITLRALDVLRGVDLIACEDTRHTLKLLNRFDISNKLISYHEHNEHERAEELVSRLARGESIAIVSDAGTPGINDPGFRIVQRAIETGAPVISIPGAAAFVTAAIASGLPTDSIFFGGFLPSKQTERRARLVEVADVPATLAFYEAPHRLLRSLADCYQILGDRQAVVAREMTKLHEEFIRGGLSELASKLSKSTIKGEIVLLIDRQRHLASSLIDADPTSVAARVTELESTGLDRKTALKQAAREMNLSKSAAYRLLLENRT
jgi:16S rRNA (cytidine1402-2'-O)-methyltransferase